MMAANMEDLEDQAATMAWHWDTNDIDTDEDDRKQWVPMTPQTMRTVTNSKAQMKLPIKPSGQDLPKPMPINP